MAPTLTEQQFGITKYLTKSQEFLAIIKHRYSDFHVFEIDLLGKRINLTQTKYIPPIIEPIVTINDEILITDEDKCNKLAIIIDIPNMYELIMSFLAPDSELQYLEILAPAEKDRRTNIHTFIRKNFQGRLGTTFDPKTNQIKIEKFNNKFHKDRVKRLCYKDRGGDYLHFTLYKEEKDTMSIIEYISRVSKIPAKDFNIAGTKDRRAISTQRVSVKKVKAEKLQGLNKILRNARLGNFEYSNEQLNLGDLNGNHFKIAMRSVIGNRDLIENSLKSLQSFGFINYYGMQRFGTRSVSTSTIGIKLLSEKWEEAIDLIMAVQEDDIGLYKEARDHWSASKNVKETLDLFPKRSLAERSILKSYLVDAEGHLAAVSAIPRNLRLMYVHAYQSLVFNYMVSERIEKYGNELVVGDLVLVENAKDDAQLEGLGVIDDDVIGDAINNRRETKQIVKIVQESDLNNYTIYDVVLPLPGHSVTYPSNSIGESYKSFMLKDGFDPDNMKRALNLAGAYRKIVNRPTGLSWQFLNYDDEEELIRSDLSRLENRSFEIKTGKNLALILEFDLSSSSYATMMIRELTKNETGSSYQAKLSQIENNKKEIENQSLNSGGGVKRAGDDLQHESEKCART